MTRPDHLTRGWCWGTGADSDSVWPEWGIYGHVTSAEASEIVDAYDGEPAGPVEIYHDWRRNVPCRGCLFDCGGSHLERASGPGRGASPYTWVTRRAE